MVPTSNRVSSVMRSPAWASPPDRSSAASFGWILREAHTQASYAAFIVPFVVAGIGVSMALPAPSAAGLNAAPPALLGRAAGVMNTVQQIGQATGVAVVTVVFEAHGSLDSPAAMLSGYQPALVTAATLSMSGAAVALRMGRRRRAPSSDGAGLAADEITERAAA